MQGQDVIFSSECADWRTPLPLFKALDAEFTFRADAAASQESSLASIYFGPGSSYGPNGLFAPWHHWSPVFCNPPYSRRLGLPIEPWLAKARRAQGYGAISVLLIPARTDTIWWHRYVMAASEVRFIRGRVPFWLPEEAIAQRNARRAEQGKKPIQPAGAGFPSAVVIYRPDRGVRGFRAPRFLTWDYRRLTQPDE